jgi:hypothetical protein
MDQVIATGLAKQPTDRYSSTVAMAAAARQAITDPMGLRPARRRAECASVSGTQRSATPRSATVCDFRQGQ